MGAPFSKARLLVPSSGLSRIGLSLAGPHLGCAEITKDGISCDFGFPRGTDGVNHVIETNRGLLNLTVRPSGDGFDLGVKSPVRGLITPQKTWERFLQGQGVSVTGLWSGHFDQLAHALKLMDANAVSKIYGGGHGFTWCDAGFTLPPSPSTLDKD